MADLESFTKLFDELKAEVESLQRRSISLTQDIASLDAKKAYSERQLAESNDKLATAAERANRATMDLQAKLKLAQDAYDELVDQNVELENKRLHMVSVIKTIQETHESEVIKLATVLKDKQQEIVAAGTRSVELAEDIERLQTTQKTAQKKLLELEEIVAAKQAESDKKIVELDNRGTFAESELTGINDIIEEARTEHQKILHDIKVSQKELVSYEVKHAEFLEYEKRAKAALQSKEQSLIEREQELDVQAVRSKRRSVLDNI